MQTKRYGNRFVRVPIARAMRHGPSLWTLVGTASEVLGHPGERAVLPASSILISISSLFA
jgi:hypothetical protein